VGVHDEFAHATADLHHARLAVPGYGVHQLAASVGAHQLDTGRGLAVEQPGTLEQVTPELLLEPPAQSARAPDDACPPDVLGVDEVLDDVGEGIHPGPPQRLGPGALAERDHQARVGARVLRAGGHHLQLPLLVAHEGVQAREAFAQDQMCGQMTGLPSGAQRRGRGPCCEQGLGQEITGEFDEVHRT
jgi:hypothetical protein